MSKPYPIVGTVRNRRRCATLRLVRDGVFAMRTDNERRTSPVRWPKDVFALMQPYAAREIGESFWILPLDSQHNLAADAPIVITRGILNAALVHPREVFASAIVASAAALICVHNHPSGDPTPSDDD